eukprot:GHVN01057293.1.p1 GENE.GHVN01057293.1~~GHVN01057293.1.p1  ORF type:complete len:739 (-),score=46.74 GHVN01057293.1:948-3164(-)
MDSKSSRSHFSRLAKRMRVIRVSAPIESFCTGRIIGAVVIVHPYANCVLVRDQYANVGDFAWYLVVLADIARTRSGESSTAERVAYQLVDITVRVPAVRVYAVELACLLVDPAETTAPISQQILASCAWILGEYHAELEACTFSYKDAFMAVMHQASAAPNAIGGSSRSASLQTKDSLTCSSPVRTMCNFTAAVQQMCIWSALKLLYGARSMQIAAGDSSATWRELREVLRAKLPIFIQSSHVEVSERALLAYHLADSLGESCSGAVSWTFPTVKPVSKGSQLMVPPPGIRIDEPFFDMPPKSKKVITKTVMAPAVSLKYESDVGLDHGAAVEVASARRTAEVPNCAVDAQGVQPTSVSYPQIEQAAPQQGNMERIKGKIMSQARNTRYSVIRSAEPPQERSSSDDLLPSLSSLDGRIWCVVAEDSNVAVYGCVRRTDAAANNITKALSIRVDFRYMCKSQSTGADLANLSVSLCQDGLPMSETTVVHLATGSALAQSEKITSRISVSPPKCMAALLSRDSTGSESGKMSLAVPLTGQISYSFGSSGTSETNLPSDWIYTSASLLFPGEVWLSAMPTDAEGVATLLKEEHLTQQCSRKATLRYSPGQKILKKMGGTQGAAQKSVKLAYSVMEAGAKLCNCFFVRQAEDPPDGNTGQLSSILAAKVQVPETAAGPLGLLNSVVVGLVSCGVSIEPTNSNSPVIVLAMKVNVKSCHQILSGEVVRCLLSMYESLTSGKLN